MSLLMVKQAKKYPRKSLTGVIKKASELTWEDLEAKLARERERSEELNFKRFKRYV